MEIINRWINWKKNIQPKNYFGLSVFFDTSSVTFEELISRFEMINLELSDIELKNLIINGGNTIDHSIHGKKFRFEINIDKSVDKIFKSFGIIEYVKDNTLLWLNVNYKSSFANCELIQKISTFSDIHVMIFFNQAFFGWENKTSPESYKYKGGLVEYFNKDFQMKMIDISHRPGRFKLTSHYRFVGGSDYWFGKSFFKHISKSEMQSFKDCLVKEELENEIIHIKLFELEDYWLDENQEKLRKLRLLLKVDE